MTVRIASAASYPDDRPESAGEIARSLEVDFMVFSYLNDAVLGELAIARQRDATRGFVPQFLTALEKVCPALFLQPQLRLLSTAGVVNPRACASEAAQVLAAHGCEELPLAVVFGDDLIDRLEELTLAGCSLDERDSGERFRELRSPPIFARAWLGAGGFVEALGDGARLVVAGSATAPVLTAAAAVDHHGWSGAVFDRVAVAAAVGQCFQGRSACLRALNLASDQRALRANPAYLVAEIDADAQVRLAKTRDGDGELSAVAVVADLQSATRTPDVTIDARAASVDAVSDVANAAAIHGLRGSPPTDTFDVSLGLVEGFEAQTLLQLEEDANGIRDSDITDVLEQRLQRRGVRVEQLNCEPLTETLFLVGGWSTDRAAAACLAAELAWLRGVACTESRLTRLTHPEVRTRLRVWHTEVPKDLVEHTVDCRPAREWV